MTGQQHFVKNKYALPWNHQKAEISTLPNVGLTVWPIAMIAETTSVFEVTKQNLTGCLYLIISFKWLNEIT